MAKGIKGNKGRGKIFFEKYGKFISKGREVEYHKEWQFARRSKVIEILGGKCKRCGFSDFRALHIDHVNSNGHQERRKYRGSSLHFYKDFLNDILNKSDYQILCANCNHIKRIVDKEYGNQHG